ncbi:MAG: zinc-dependent alcohol dehydrogenase family protein, partial [Pyrinomonadaceae bacterium]
YNPKLPLPLIPVSDGAGEVVAIGKKVTRFKNGDRVAPCFHESWIDGHLTSDVARSDRGGHVSGVLAEYVTIPEHGVVKTPPALSFEEAATLPCAALTAWNALFEAAGIKSGETVLVQGTGGVSIFALQFAHAAGARVIITSSSNDKLARATELGAGFLINYREVPDWDVRVQEMTDGLGVDQVIEVGGAGTLFKSLRAVKPAGTISLIGVLSGIESKLNIAPILHKSLRVCGIYVGSRRMFEEMNRAIEVNKIKPVIDRVFEFNKAAEAYHYLESGQHFGKVVISGA